FPLPNPSDNWITSASPLRFGALDSELELGNEIVIRQLHFGGVGRFVSHGLDENIHGLVDFSPNIGGLLLQGFFAGVPRYFKLAVLLFGGGLMVRFDCLRCVRSRFWFWGRVVLTRSPSRFSPGLARGLRFLRRPPARPAGRQDPVSDPRLHGASLFASRPAT